MLPKFTHLFKLSTARRYGRIALWAGSRLGQLLSASVEVFLRRNMGRRYMFRVLPAFLLCALYTAAAPRGAVLMRPFLFSFFVMVIYHVAFISARRHLGLAEPHTYSTGTCLTLWRHLRLQQSWVRCFFEPAVCLVLARATFPVDPMFSVWLAAAAISLFVKEHIYALLLRRRVMDMADSRIESQELSGAVDQYTNPRAGHTEGFQQAHLPRGTPRPRRRQE